MYKHFCFILLIFGGERETRTLAPLTRPTSLAGKPLHQLGYFSIFVNYIIKVNNTYILFTSYITGGEGGIRTHGRLQTYANFQDWCHKPTRPPLHISDNIYNTTVLHTLSIEFFGFFINLSTDFLIYY